MTINVNNIILYILIPIWVIVELFLVKWMFKSKPDRNRINKYPKKIIFMSQLPLGSKWKKRVDKDDIKIFEQYQNRIKVWSGSVIIFFCLFIGYIYLAF
jgi:hypothetical protein